MWSRSNTTGEKTNNYPTRNLCLSDGQVEAAGHIRYTNMTEINNNPASSTTNTAPLSATKSAEKQLG
jgi:hypothetical protein